MEELLMQRLKGYAEVKIVGMRHHYKSSDGQRLLNPWPGCPVSLQLEPSNPYHHNAIKVINEIDTRHLGYIVREIADPLTLLLKDNTFVSARGILSVPRPHCCSLEVISCQVLLFFAVPHELVPPLPPQLGFHEDLSSPNFVLSGTPVAFTGCTLHDYDSYKAHCMASLHLQRRIKQPLLRPCSTNANSPVHVCDSDAIAPPEPPPQFQTQIQTQTRAGTQSEVQDTAQRNEVTCSTNANSPVHVCDSDAIAPAEPPPQFQTQIQTQTRAGTQSEVQDTAQRNEVTCMKCKQTGGGPFFQCAWSGCPLLIHESCMGDVIGDHCDFCLYLTCRKEYLQSRKDSSSRMAACREEYKKARDIAIRFLGGNTFMRLRELTGLDPIPPPQVQLPHNTDAPTDEAGIFDHCRGFDGMEESQNSVRVADQTKKGTDLLPPTKAQTQIQTQTRAGTQSEVQGTAQRNEVTCMKCKQTGGGSFFQCAWSGCPLLIHESCMVDVIGNYCHFCLYVTRRKEYHQSRKDSSSCTAACKEEYKKARDIAIQFLGGDTFMRMRELTGLDPLPPPQVQLPHNMNAPTDEAVIFDHGRGFDGTVESQNSVRVADQTKKGTDLLPPTKAQTQVVAAEMNEIVCMKCKQTGSGLFFQCAQSGCPLLVHESCIAGVVDRTCLFCLFLARRGERLRAKKGSDLYVSLKAKYEEARKSAIRFFGKETFMRLRELAGLDPLLPTQVQVQVPCNANMQCYTEEGREKEVVGMSTVIEKSASKEKKEKVKDAANSAREKNQEEKVVGRGKRRLPPRLSLDRACKKRIQASLPPCQLVQGHRLETN